jgi:hypothetical protein
LGLKVSAMTVAARAARVPDWTAEQSAHIAPGLTAWDLRQALMTRPPRLMSAPYTLRSRSAGTPCAAARPRRPGIGDRVQFFTVTAIAPHAMTLAVEDGHLDALSHLRVVPDGPGRDRADLGSEVWIWNRVGRLYMLPVGPGNRLLVRAMLRVWRRSARPPRASGPLRRSRASPARG